MHLSANVDWQLVEEVLLEFAKWNREAAAEHRWRQLMQHFATFHFY
jgi:hypothetical protein